MHRLFSFGILLMLSCHQEEIKSLRETIVKEKEAQVSVLRILESAVPDVLPVSTQFTADNGADLTTLLPKISTIVKSTTEKLQHL